MHGNRIWRRVSVAVRRQQHALNDSPGRRFDHDQLRRFAGGDKPFAVRTERKRLRSQIGQFDLNAGGGKDLIGWRIKTVFTQFAHCRSR